MNVLRGLPRQDAQAVRQVLQQATPSSTSVRQLSMPLRESAGSRTLAPTTTRSGRVTPADTAVGGRLYNPSSAASPRNMETVRLSQQPRAVDTFNPLTPAPRGQMSIDAAPVPAFGEGFKFGPAPTNAVVPLSPRAVELAQADPGTFNSIRQIATDAENYYGIRQGGLVNALVEPGGTDVLRYLDAGDDLASAVSKARGGALAPTGSADLMTPGGRMVRSPGGPMVPSDIIDVDVNDLGSVAGQRQAMRNSAAGVQMGDLSRMLDPKMLALMGGTAAAGLALGNIGNIASSFNEGGGAPGVGETPLSQEFPQAPVLFRDNSGTPLGEESSAYSLLHTLVLLGIQRNRLQ
jgi:hypothetical protein